MFTEEMFKDAYVPRPSKSRGHGRKGTNIEKSVSPQLETLFLFDKIRVYVLSCIEILILCRLSYDDETKARPAPAQGKSKSARKPPKKRPATVPVKKKAVRSPSKKSDRKTSTTPKYVDDESSDDEQVRIKKY